MLVYQGFKNYFQRTHLVPIVLARFLKTKLNKNGPDVSDAIDVPLENVERRRPPLDDLWLIADEAREDQPHIEDSRINEQLKTSAKKTNTVRRFSRTNCCTASAPEQLSIRIIEQTELTITMEHNPNH